MQDLNAASSIEQCVLEYKETDIAFVSAFNQVLKVVLRETGLAGCLIASLRKPQGSADIVSLLLTVEALLR